MTAEPNTISAETRARRRSAAVVLAGALLAGAGLFANFGGWHSDKANAVETSLASAEARLAAANAQADGAEKRLADLTRERAETEAAIADGAKRVAALDERREILRRQVAELTGPISDPAEAERAAEDAPEPPAPRKSTATVDAPAPAAQAEAEPESDPSEEAAGLEEGQSDGEPERRTSTASVDGAPAAGPVRVFIHIQTTDLAARARANALAADLRRRGVEVAQIRGVRLPIRQNMVRYFYDADRDAAATLQSAISETSGSSAEAQDYRGFRAAPRQGTLEIWMS